MSTYRVSGPVGALRSDGVEHNLYDGVLLRDGGLLQRRGGLGGRGGFLRLEEQVYFNYNLSSFMHHFK